MSRARILFALLALIALSAILAACGGSGGSDDPQKVVDEATLQGIESGEIDLAANVDVEGKKAGNLDIKLSGPFQSEEEAKLPELDLAFSVKGKMDGEAIDREGGFTLLGNKAYVGYEGTEYAVDRNTFSYVQSLTEQGGGQGQSGEVAACKEAAKGIELNDLVESLKDEGSADVGGTDTTKVSGELNGSGALDAFSQLIEDPACSQQLEAAGSLPSVAELDDAKGTVKQSLKSAHVELYVGDDHIIRRVTAKATIEPSQDAKASAKRVDIDLDLTLTGVNEEQSISAPSRAKPLSALFLKLGINPLELLEAFQGGSSVQGLGNLLKKLNGAGSSGGGGSGAGGGETYYECLGKAHTAVDIQDCTGLLQ